MENAVKDTGLPNLKGIVVNGMRMIREDEQYDDDVLACFDTHAVP